MSSLECHAQGKSNLSRLFWCLPILCHTYIKKAELTLTLEMGVFFVPFFLPLLVVNKSAMPGSMLPFTGGIF